MCGVTLTILGDFCLHYKDVLKRLRNKCIFFSLHENKNSDVVYLIHTQSVTRALLPESRCFEFLSLY